MDEDTILEIKEVLNVIKYRLAKLEENVNDFEKDIQDAIMDSWEDYE